MDALRPTEAAVTIVKVVEEKIVSIKSSNTAITEAINTECEEEELRSLIDKAKDEAACEDLKRNLDMGKALFRALFPRVRAKA